MKICNGLTKDQVISTIKNNLETYKDFKEYIKG